MVRAISLQFLRWYIGGRSAATCRVVVLHGRQLCPALLVGAPKDVRPAPARAERFVARVELLACVLEFAVRGVQLSQRALIETEAPPPLRFRIGEVSQGLIELA